jgi:hypothetical protein
MQVAQQVDAGAWGSFHDRRPSTITLFRVRRSGLVPRGELIFTERN